MLKMPPLLSPEDVRRACAAESFDFETTTDLPELAEVLGQPRAIEALEFGASIASHGFNLFALGLPGSGKTTLIREYLERRAINQPVPLDLCYVNNFLDARRPTALRLPAGHGPQFQRDIAALIVELREAIPKAFETKAYDEQRDTIVHDVEAKVQAELTRLEEYVARRNFQLVPTSSGLMLLPTVNGKLISESELQALKPDEQQKLIEQRNRLGEDVEEGVRRKRELEKGARDALRALDAETATYAVRHIVAELRTRYSDRPEVLTYLDALQADVIEHADNFRKGREAEAAASPIGFTPPGEDPFTRYKVNVLIDNHTLTGAPVIVESNPTYQNLVGRIEHKAIWGAVLTDFTMIKPGALQRANGGYLIIPARECLLNPYAWDGLKRALKDRAARVEDIGAQLGVISTVTLEPEPVPLDVKVILIGSPLIYYLLNANDEDFQKLFKVKAEFTTQMDRTPEAERAYALFVRTIAQQDQLLPFGRDAVAGLVEYGSRLAEDQDKLSTRFGEIADLLREAAYRAAHHSGSIVTGQDIEAAIEARRFRQNLTEERLQEAIAKHTLLIETTGAAIGRINGLSVSSLSDYSFGHPTCITATVGPGRGGVLSIEREVELSGPIHGKGVLILSGYLAYKYKAASPLSLSADLVFEQSYGMVEGDSASLAELYALLSAIAGVPLRQDIAVTGSLNQYGRIQPIGGATEKIEGFFDVCRKRGLNGQQGVLIPIGNRRHLMLRPDVVEAVRAGQFHIWVAEDVDDGLPLLTGLEAGELTDHAVYPPGTVHRAVADQLSKYAEILKAESKKNKRPVREKSKRRPRLFS